MRLAPVGVSPYNLKGSYNKTINDLEKCLGVNPYNLKGSYNTNAKIRKKNRGVNPYNLKVVSQFES